MFGCTKYGLLKYNYTLQEIATCEENLLEMNFIIITLADDRQLTLRETAGNSSVQRYQRGYCKTGCNINVLRGRKVV
ncbi:Uncharacterized protein FWK35_00037852 [Aphis craccivora]|uniref:Uncharacterized protein n=1 Tax=Aphis craccivora TaxID=307492 RepID=A0A6G0YAG8_APHCR|nr:Uncharacterized protein FWK35_00037852 [Aphis craccivora]